VLLHAFVTDARTRIHTKEWTAEYAPGEIRYAPVALAGMVTWTFGLPPLGSAATVNSAARADYQAGLIHVRNVSGEIDAAVEDFQKAVTADPDSALTYAGLAEAEWFKYVQTQDKIWLEQATESVRQADARSPDLAPVHRIAGLLKANGGWYEQAAAEYRRAIELEPASGDAYRRLGRAYESNSQLDEALAAYQRAAELEPGYYANHLALGAFYYQRGNFSEALRHRVTAVALAPNEANTHFALAADYRNLGRFPEAEREFRVSIALRETSSALHELGAVLVYQSRDQEAIPYFQRALQLSPQKYLSWLYLGVAYRHMKAPSDAEHANRRGLELAEAAVAQDPRSGYDRSFLAFLCAQLGDRRRAESEIAQALQLSPQDADTRLMAALTYEALGRRDATLGLVTSFPTEQLAVLSRWPDVPGLHKDPRFLQLLVSHQIK
jgi:tetratricopeptide (TPR) repeat protein